MSSKLQLDVSYLS